MQMKIVEKRSNRFDEQIDNLELQTNGDVCHGIGSCDDKHGPEKSEYHKVDIAVVNCGLSLTIYILSLLSGR